jgi:GNAT superfamily N-acetyltransferase
MDSLSDFSIHSGYLPGCIGRIAELHGSYYSRHAGFGVHFESKVARELAEFCEHFDAERDGLWLALKQGRVEAAIAIDGSGAGGKGAHLRWFIASDALRGVGVGSRLLAAAIDFCHIRNYEAVYLWTFEGLEAARHLYEKSGFRLAHQQRGRQWGHEVSEQRFEMRPGTRHYAVTG